GATRRPRRASASTRLTTARSPCTVTTSRAVTSCSRSTTGSTGAERSAPMSPSRFAPPLLFALSTLFAPTAARADHIFVLILGNGKCLDVQGAEFEARANGALVQSWDCHGGP